MPASILIVEDEKVIAEAIEKRLKGFGYTVAGMAATWEEALEKVESLRPDLLLMDINLGAGMDGVAAAEIVRVRFDLPVVFLTAFSDDATLQRAKLTEPFGYILKPYEDQDLRTAIEIGLYKHRMDRHVRENEQWLAATLSSIGDGVIAIDGRGGVRFLNSIAERLTGWSAADAAGRHVTDIFRIVEEKSRDTVRNPALDALRTGEPAELAPGTMLIDRAGAEHPIDDTAAPIRGADGAVAGAVLVFRDITERRRLEDNLRQSQKMEAIGRLAGGIAHDFNNIITIISGFCEFLLSDDYSETDRKRFVRNIHDASHRAAALTQQILAFSRKQLLVPRVLDLNTVVAEMGALVKRLIGSNIEFVADLAPDLAPVKADPTQIGQVFLNLAANARDAMPKGGRLTVTTSNVVLDESTTRDFPDVASGNYALLAIADNGVGMGEAVLANIFEPFFTTKAVGRGTGLGLATAYGIVKQSGGHVAVASRPGEGTLFRIYLPSVQAAAAPVAAPARTPSKRGTETILLVEDEKTVREMMKLVLKSKGYEVLEAEDGAVALEIARAHPGTIHLLMTDLMMPRLSGRELADRLVAENRVGRVLFRSGYTEDILARQDEASSTSDFLHKPFTLDGLTTKIREVLDRHSDGPTA